MCLQHGCTFLRTDGAEVSNATLLGVNDGKLFRLEGNMSPGAFFSSAKVKLTVFFKVFSVPFLFEKRQ